MSIIFEHHYWYDDNEGVFNPISLTCFSFDFCITVISAANGPTFKNFFLPERYSLVGR